jgi:hypothetical protein
MHRLLVALGLLIGLTTAATAGTLHGTWYGTAGAASALDSQTPVVRAACAFDDRFCPFGRTRACSPDGRCWCASCERRGYYDRPRYYDGPRYYEGPRGNEGLNLQLFGGGSDDRRYSPPANGRCPRGYSIQDGLCKPYTGR